MFITKKHLSRRTVLRGAGVSLALPLLDSMIPAQTPSSKVAALPKIPRFVGIFSPHGWAPEYWPPSRQTDGEFPFILKPLAGLARFHHHDQRSGRHILHAASRA